MRYKLSENRIKRRYLIYYGRVRHHASLNKEEYRLQA